MHEVMVVGQDLGDAISFHDVHGDAIHEAILLIGTTFIQCQPALKGCMRLRDYLDLWRFQNTPYELASKPSCALTESTGASEEFRQDLLGSNESSVPEVHSCRAISPRVIGKKDRDPIKRIRKDNPQRFVDP